MNRGDVTRGLWKYIKANELQDPKNKSKIRNDERMFKVYLCDSVCTFLSLCLSVSGCYC